MASVWHEDGARLPLGDDDLRQVALGMLRARRAMRGTLPAALIHDVALEALLTIYLAHEARAPIELLVAEAEVPANSARRWLAALASEDLIVLADGQAALTDHGAASMTKMLTGVVCSQRELLGWAHH